MFNILINHLLLNLFACERLFKVEIDWLGLHRMTDSSWMCSAMYDRIG